MRAFTVYVQTIHIGKCFVRLIPISDGANQTTRICSNKFHQTATISLRIPSRYYDVAYRGGWLPPRSQLIDKIGTKFQWLPHVFGGKESNGTIGNTVRRTGSQKSKMAASNLEIRISRLVDMIATKFQRLPHVLGARYPTVILGILYDVTVSRNSRWRTPDRNLTLNTYSSACRQHRNTI